MWEVYESRTETHGGIAYCGYAGEFATETPTAAACEARRYYTQERVELWAVRPDATEAWRVEFDGQDLSVLEVIK